MIKSMVIPHSAQRYDTVGDWYTEYPGRLDIRVSALGNKDFELLVLIHELIEAFLCKKHGISGEVVDAFDMSYTGPGEPGEAPGCPYFREHQAASSVEQYVAQLLGIDWIAYTKAIEDLGVEIVFEHGMESERVDGDSSSRN